MKPIHTLTWAVAAPILLFAGASQAATLVSDLTDPNCNGTFAFDSTINTIACVAASGTTGGGTTGGGTTGGGTTGGDTTGGGTTGGGTTACPSKPASTTIVAIGGRDSYAKSDFDSVFNSPGSTFDSAVADGQDKALTFSNNVTKYGYVSATAGNYGNGYKDWALSRCPGDFTTSMGSKCVKMNMASLKLAFSTDGSLGCQIPVNEPVYLNVRGSNGAKAGWVMKNLHITSLP